MLSRILLGAVSAVAGGIFVTTAAATGSDGDPSATASAPLPELTVAPPTDYPDVRLLNGYAFSGQAAFNPADPKRLVVGIVFGTACYVKASADGGKTWGALVQLPQLAGGACTYDDSPAVTYAADGGRLYAAYIYNKPGSYCISGVAVSVSTDQGTTWSTPTSVFGDYCAEGGFFDVRVAAAPGGSWVYVAAEFYREYGGGAEEGVFFSSSGNQGSSWTPGKLIALGDTESGTWLYGFALAAGRGGNVLVAYGWTDETVHPNYTVQVARSADHGASFIYGIADQSDDFVGYPDIKIGPFGTAHLVYGKGSPGTAILYKFSPSPYSSWSAEPVRLDDDVPQANVWAPQLAVGACGQASVLHATWSEFLNEASRILYARRVAQPGYAWSRPLKVGKLKNGIYRNGLAAAGSKAFSIFSGRTSPDPPNKWGIAGSRVSSGITCS